MIFVILVISFVCMYCVWTTVKPVFDFLWSVSSAMGTLGKIVTGALDGIGSQTNKTEDAFKLLKNTRERYDRIQAAFGEV